MSKQTAIEARGITRTFEDGRIKALDGIDLVIQPGELVAIVGPSGCGKSTLLHLIAALDRPTAGTLSVFGENLAELRNPSRYRSRGVGIVFQLDNLLPTLTASENVQVPMFELGISRKERRARALHLLEQMGLTGKADQRPADLSGGERQRVAIARALANQPRLLLADEPTGRLDSASGRRMLDLLEELHHRTGLTVVIVTHDMDVARRADRIIHMLDGRIAGDEVVRSDPAQAGTTRGNDGGQRAEEDVKQHAVI